MTFIYYYVTKMYFMVYDNWPTNYIFWLKLKVAKLFSSPTKNIFNLPHTRRRWVSGRYTSFKHVAFGSRNVFPHHVTAYYNSSIDYCHAIPRLWTNGCQGWMKNLLRALSSSAVAKSWNINKVYLNCTSLYNFIFAMVIMRKI